MTEPGATAARFEGVRSAALSVDGETVAVLAAVVGELGLLRQAAV